MCVLIGAGDTRLPRTVYPLVKSYSDFDAQSMASACAMIRNTMETEMAFANSKIPYITLSVLAVTQVTKLTQYV